MGAVATSWKCVPFTQGVPITFSAEFSSDELSLLEAGLVPKQMEDKWFVYFETPHLYFHRSWTGKPVYRVTLKSASNGTVVVSEALWATEFADAGNADPNYQPRLLDFLISNLLLKQSKPFPIPAEFKESTVGVFQHHISGTGYHELVINRKKSWWKFW